MEKPNVNNDTEVRIHANSPRSEENLVRTRARISSSLIKFAAAVFAPFNVDCGCSFSFMAISISEVT